MASTHRSPRTPAAILVGLSCAGLAALAGFEYAKKFVFAPAAAPAPVVVKAKPLTAAEMQEAQDYFCPRGTKTKLILSNGTLVENGKEGFDLIITRGTLKNTQTLNCDI